MLDPACGTGGFLIVAMSHVIEAIRKGEWRPGSPQRPACGDNIRQRVRTLRRKNIVGIDFNPSLVKAAK